MNDTDLSKEISYALRHAPQNYQLELDENGWVELDDLVQALRKKHKFEKLELSDVERATQNSSKRRHEIYNGRIRALYGHSHVKRIDIDCKKPPDLLYHGTANRFVSNILSLGLLSMKRQYVHLSEDVETAIDVGKRRDATPVIIEVVSSLAHNEGVSFFHAYDTIWLVEHVPSKYLKILNGY